MKTKTLITKLSASLLLMTMCLTVYAQKTVVVSFSLSDFQFRTENGCMQIATSLKDRRIAGDLNRPHLPYFPCRIVIPGRTRIFPWHTPLTAS